MPLLLLLGTNAIPFSVTVVIVIVVAVAIAVAVPVVAAASVASSRTNFSESEFFREEKKLAPKFRSELFRPQHTKKS